MAILTCFNAFELFLFKYLLQFEYEISFIRFENAWMNDAHWASLSSGKLVGLFIVFYLILSMKERKDREFLNLRCRALKVVVLFSALNSQAIKWKIMYGPFVGRITAPGEVAMALTLHPS